MTDKPSLIEIMARALDPEAWGNTHAAFRLRRDMSANNARSVLRAMVEHGPTERMLMAGNAVGDYPWDGRKPGRVLDAMLRAELVEDAP